MNAAAVPSAAELAELCRQLLAESDRGAGEAARRLAAMREARAAALAEGEQRAEAAWAAGYAAAIADVKAAQHGIVRPLARAAEVEAARWMLRGQARTRATFADAHPGDYAGGPVAWAPGWAPGAGEAPEGMRGAA